MDNRYETTGNTDHNNTETGWENMDIENQDGPEKKTTRGEEIMSRERSLGLAAALACDVELKIPSWKDIKEMRDNNPNRPSVFWIKDGILRVKFGEQEEDLTPKEALQKYKDNEEFLKEYLFLMGDGNPAVAGQNRGMHKEPQENANATAAERTEMFKRGAF